MTTRRTIALDLVLLTALCGVIFGAGLTTHGLTNWQEAQRAYVAREMARSGEWIVPTVHGEPYLAKPPMIYWTQLALDRVIPGPIGELELRLSVALGGWLGVLATYLFARALLVRDPVTLRDDQRWSRRTALWASTLLATGMLYVRSSRIGELDILLVPSVVAATGALALAWRHHMITGRMRLRWVLVACVGAAAAGLTKGPPGLLVLICAAYGGMLLWAAWARELPGHGFLRRDAEQRRVAGGARAAWVVGLFAAALIAWRTIVTNDKPEWVGVVLLALGAGLLGATLGRLINPVRARALLAVMARTHPVGVAVAGMAPVIVWGRLVSARIGADAVRAAASGEAADNLRVLVSDSPLNNLEAAAFGVGLGSVAAALFFVWLWKERPRWTVATFVIVAWVAFGLLAFSALGKGVARYLTPIWPGVALAGGLWLTTGARQLPGTRWIHRSAAVVVVVLALGQAWWYGLGREAYFGERCPRALVAELRGAGARADEVGVFEFSTAALEYYWDAELPVYIDPPATAWYAGPAPEPIGTLVQRLERSGGSAVLLVRATQPDELPAPDPAARLEARGLSVEPIASAARFVIDSGRTEVVAVRVRAATSGGRASPGR